MEEDKSAVAFVNGRFFHRGDAHKEDTAVEKVLTHKWDGPVARVRRACGLTLSLGPYESARFDVSLEVPCLPEDIDAADKFAQDWVESRIQEEADQIKENKPSKVSDSY